MERVQTMLKCPDPECQKPKTKCKYCPQRHRKVGHPVTKIAPHSWQTISNNIIEAWLK
jgi:hypothetical protein